MVTQLKAVTLTFGTRTYLKRSNMTTCKVFDVTENDDEVLISCVEFVLQCVINTAAVSLLLRIWNPHVD